MRFEGEFDSMVLIKAIILTSLISLALPTKKSARGYILIVAHYFFFLPSIVYLAFNSPHQEYILALTISVFCIYFGSMIPIKTIAVQEIDKKKLLNVLFVFIATALISQIYFGGLNRFNLNMEMVYEFRGDAASALPAIFGYIYSNVANVLIPSFIVLALHLRKKNVAYIGLLLSLILFGMSHHKSIIFVSVLVFILFFAMKNIKNLPAFALLPISLLFICVVEVFYNLYISNERQVSMLTSYIVRRALLVPPMLDASAIELFSESAKYYWSTSRLGFGIVENPHGVSAPFLLGIHFFNDPGLSANPGNIGSGYSHAGLLGVFIYSFLTGIMISFINTIGKKVGHSLVAAISIPTLLIILTSADLTTTLLSHGVLALIILLIFIPRMHVVIIK
jgi:oligosaccharide repeat unit polymerase